MSKTKHKWMLTIILGAAAWALAFPAVPTSAQTPTLNPPVISCDGATDTTITIKVCGGATTGAPAGFSLQWVPSGTGFDNVCSASFSGVPTGSTFDLAPGECVDVVIAQPTGAIGESFQCTGDLACSADYDFRAFAHNVPPTDLSQGFNRSDFTATLVCSTASCPLAGGGCSPGFWKNRAVTLELYDTSRTLGSVFTFGPDFTSFASNTFLEALNFKGGNTIQDAAEILLRAAVAAVLNAENPSVGYPRTVTEVVTAVNGVLNTTTPSRDSILALAASLDADNNLQCPLGDGNSDLTGSAAKAAKKAAKANKKK